MERRIRNSRASPGYRVLPIHTVFPLNMAPGAKTNFGGAATFKSIKIPDFMSIFNSHEKGGVNAKKI